MADNGDAGGSEASPGGSGGGLVPDSAPDVGELVPDLGSLVPDAAKDVVPDLGGLLDSLPFAVDAALGVVPGAV